MEPERVIDALRKVGVRFPDDCPLCRTLLKHTKITARNGIAVICEHCGYAFPFDGDVLAATLKEMETAEKMQSASRQQRRAYEREMQKKSKS